MRAGSTKTRYRVAVMAKDYPASYFGRQRPLVSGFDGAIIRHSNLLEIQLNQIREEGLFHLSSFEIARNRHQENYCLLSIRRTEAKSQLSQKMKVPL